MKNDCWYCNGKGYRVYKVAHEEIRDCHRSGGTYYTKEHRKCRECDGTGKSPINRLIDKKLMGK